MAIQTITWDSGKIKLIDQTKLPLKLKYIYCSNLKQLWHAIKSLQVRGAPALGIAAALGVVLGIQKSKVNKFVEFSKILNKITNYIGSARPTAVNLFNSLERMRKVTYANSKLPIKRLKKLLLKEALKIIEEDRSICRRMAGFGVKLIKQGDRILTLCNAGALATADYGTALGVIYRAKELKKDVKVFVCETRPLLQGARLTTWELMRHNLNTTLICDNMAATLMSQGKIDKIFVGADRIAQNGDTANKIGTYNLAIIANYHRIPFYIVAPQSTFDMSIKSGRLIPIETRDKNEVIKIFGKKVAPSSVNVYNPAFDVTPHKLITAIITEYGIILPPFKSNIKKIFTPLENVSIRKRPKVFRRLRWVL